MGVICTVMHQHDDYGPFQRRLTIEIRNISSIGRKEKVTKMTTKELVLLFGFLLPCPSHDRYRAVDQQQLTIFESVEMCKSNKRVHAI